MKFHPPYCGLHERRMGFPTPKFQPCHENKILLAGKKEKGKKKERISTGSILNDN